MRTCWQAIVAILFLVCGLGAWAQQIQGPKMVLKEEIFDFKEVWEGEVIEHVFQVFNQGDQILEIKAVRPV